MSSTSDTLLTIILPSFNAESCIEATLMSIAAQSFQSYEVLVIDNASTDTTKEIVTRRMANDSRIHFVSENDKGIYDAMNKGVQLAKGQWLYFTGSDDVLHHPSVLETLAAFFTTSYDLVYGDVRWVPENIHEQGEWDHRRLLQANINHQRIFYHKSLFVQYGGYDLQYKVAADHALNIRLFCNKAVRKKYVPVIVADYHSGGFSASKTDEVFWKNWNNTVLQHFRGLLPVKEIYGSLNSYYRYLLQQEKYGKAVTVAVKVFIYTKSPGFVVLAIKQFFQSFKQHAA